MKAEDIEHRFTYYPPTDPAVRKAHEHARSEAKQLAYVWLTLPEGREQSLAVTALEESLFWANAAIARKGSAQ